MRRTAAPPAPCSACRTRCSARPRPGCFQPAAHACKPLRDRPPGACRGRTPRPVGRGCARCPAAAPAPSQRMLVAQLGGQGGITIVILPNFSYYKRFNNFISSSTNFNLVGSCRWKTSILYTDTIEILDMYTIVKVWS